MNLENLTLLKVRKRNLRLGKSLYQEQSQFGGVCREPWVIQCRLLVKMYHLLQDGPILDLIGSNLPRERANAHAASEIRKGVLRADKVGISILLSATTITPVFKTASIFCKGIP